MRLAEKPLVLHPGFEAPTPRAYQKDGAAALQRARRWLLSDEPGLGKTGQVLMAIEAMDPEAVRRVLVLSPASARFTWLREISKWLEGPVSAAVILGGKTCWLCTSVRGGELRRYELATDWRQNPDVLGAQFILANYDIVPKFREFFVRGWKDWKEQKFSDLPNWNLVVLDEAHMLAHADTQRTASVIGRWGKERTRGLCEKAERVWALSGTPIQNRPIDFHTILRTVGAGVFPGDRHKFGVKYCNAQLVEAAGQKHWDYSGASSLEELHARLKFCSTRRLKADVLKDLPAKTREVVVIPATPSARALLEREWALFAQLTGEAGTEIILDTEKERRTHRLRIGDHALRVVSGGLSIGQFSAYRKLLAMEKAPAVIEHITAALEGGREKVLVFTIHTEIAKTIHEALESYGSGLIIGETGAAAREREVKAFHEGPGRVLVGNIIAMGTNLTLHANGRCSLAIMAEPSFVPSQSWQAEDRLHRYGQTDNVLIQYLVVADSVEAAVIETMIDKHSVIRQALDGKAGECPFSGTVETTS